MNGATAAVTRTEALSLVLAAIALSVYFTWPLASDLGGLGRIALGDGQFSVWNVAWVAHALTSDAAVFNANIFHPHRTTLAYSEANLGAGLIAVPAYLLTRNPYAAHNSAVLISLTCAVIGMYLLARRLTGSREAAMVAAIVFAFCPFFFARTSHIQLMMTAPLPFTLLAFHVFADRPGAKAAVVLGLAIAVQALFCAYYGVLVGLLVGLGVLVYAVQRRLWRQPRWWGLSLLAAGVSVAAVLPFFLPYITLQENTGFERPLAEAVTYSANWRAYFASSAHAHNWMLPLLQRWPEVLFPGFTALLLGGFGAVMVFRQRGRRDRPAAPALPRDAAVFYLLTLVLALWISFGPAAGLYSWLYHTIPVFSLLRAPARFGIAVTLALAVFTAATVTVILGRFPQRWRGWVTAALALFAIGELTTSVPYLPARDVPRAYKVLAAAERGPVVEFPFYYQPHNRYRQTLYMLGSTAHWQPLVNGYSDFIPPDFFEGGRLLESFPDAAGLEWLRARGTRYAVFHMGLYDHPDRARLDARIQAHAADLQPKYTFGAVHLYEIIGGTRLTP